MARFSFLQRDTLAEQARGLRLAAYTPALPLQGLLTGVDNLRHDVFLSARFTDLARQHIAALIARHGDVQQILAENLSTFQPPSVMRPAGGRARPPDAVEFKRCLAGLHVAALNRAKTEENLSIDLLARVAILKFLRAKLATQFAQVLEQCRARLKASEGPRAALGRALTMREKFAAFQVNKKTVLRKVGQELFETLREIEKETLSRMRRSLFGEADPGTYELFLNRLIFTEDGRDDVLNAEHYVMLGNFERDPDRFASIQQLACRFLRSLELPDSGDPAALVALLNVPENALELLAGGCFDESSANGKSKAQRALLAAWVDLLQHQDVIEHVLASYEVVTLLGEYSPPINAQQLKNALISRVERKRVEELLEQQGRVSPDNLHLAARRVAACRGAERARVAARFLRDFMCYHRDRQRLEVLSSAMDCVNVITNEKLRELSAVNSTLYEFLLADEQKPAEDKVLDHAILKADIRDSSTLTRTLLERGLNPASHFSLNFFDPLNKLLPIFGAEKVFIEGDAVILAILEREGEPPFGVARCCALAKELLVIVNAYNAHSRRAGLPVLELGIGISYQDSPPLYLMDGSSRIMISSALNASDRLSSCSKVARNYLAERATPFNIHVFQTVEDADSAGMPDEFLVRYNIGGIAINEQAFEKLKQEISLQGCEVSVPTLWDEPVLLYSGVVPVASGGFHKLVVREGRVPRIDPRGFTFKHWTDRRYYEVCTSAAIYSQVEESAARPVAVR